jgi:hypothetical protein
MLGTEERLSCDEGHNVIWCCCHSTCHPSRPAQEYVLSSRVILSTYLKSIT